MIGALFLCMIPAGTGHHNLGDREVKRKIGGLQYNRARQYDPKVGRWTAQDPIGFAGGDPDLYAYTGQQGCRDAGPSSKTKDSTRKRERTKERKRPIPPFLSPSARNASEKT